MKSVIDIDINADEFKQFSDLFDKYQEKLQKMPGAWANVNKEVKSGFEAVAAALLAQNELNRRIENETKDTANSSHSIANYWSDAASSAGKFAGKISDATRDLIKWTGITAGITGLLGFGGLWGLDALAGRVGYNRRANQGLGISQGERSAFNLNYGRITDTPDQYLNDINSSLFDPSQRYRLYAAGVGNQTNTASAALAVMDSYRKLALQTPDSLMGAVLKARGNFMSLQDFERLKSLSPEEYSSIRQNYNSDRVTMQQQDVTMRKWQEFNIQLSRAGTNIENAFIVGLTPLIPQLDRFSKVVAGMVTNFMKWVDESGAIDKASGGLKKLGDWLSDPKTQQAFEVDAKMLIGDIIAVASWMHGTLTKLGIVKDDVQTKGVLGAAQGIKKSIQGESPEVFGPWAALLPAIAKAESNNNPNAISSRGALGMYQLMPSTAAQYGVTNPFNPQQSANGAARFLGDLAARYGNDVTKMLAAYNWGPGNLDADIKKYGNDWYKHLPKETQQYEEKILRNRDAFMTAARAPGADTSSVRVEIFNFTGSDIVATAGQIAK